MSAAISRHVIRGLAAALLASPALGAPAAPVQLLGVSVQPDKVVFHMTRPVSYDLSVESDPPRISIHLAGVRHAAASELIKGRGAALEWVRTGQIGPPAAPVTQVSLQLKRPADFRASWNGANLSLLFTPVGPASSAVEAPTPPAPVAAAPAGRWWVQLGSFISGPRAAALQAALGGEWASGVYAVSRSGTRFFQVRVGPFPDRASAQTAAERLAAKGEHPLVVRR